MFRLWLLVFTLPAFMAGGALTAAEEPSRAGLQTPGFALDMGFHYFFEGDLERAIQYFHKYIEMTGGDEVSFRHMGKIYLMQSSYGEAEKYLQMALKADPNSEESLILLGNLYLDRQDGQKALEVYEKLVELSPTNEQVLYILAQIYVSMENPRKATVYYKKLAAAALSNGRIGYYLSQAYQYLGEYSFQIGDYQSSLDYFQKLLEINPQDINTIFSVSELYRLNGEFSKSAEILEKIIPYLNDREQVIVLESLIDSMFTVGHIKTGVYLNSYLKLNDKPDVLLDAIRYLYLNELEKSKNLFEEVLSENPARISARVGLYQIAFKENDFGAMKREAFSVALLAQKIGAYKLSNAYNQHVFRVMEESFPEFEDWFKGDPIDLTKEEADKTGNHAADYIELYYNHGYTLEKMDRPDQALAYYREGLQHGKKLASWYDFLAAASDTPGEYDDRIELNTSREYDLRLKILQTYLTAPEAGDIQIESHLEGCFAISQEDPRAYYLGGLILFQEERGPEGQAEGQDEKTLQYFDEAVKKSEALSREGRAPAVYYFYRGIVYEKLRRFPAMEADLKIAIELDPYNSIYLNYLGYKYSVEKRDLEKALGYITRALEDEPDNEAYLDTLGWIYFQMEKYEEALGQLLVAKSYADKKHRKDAVITYHLAETYFKLDRKPSALLYYKQTLEAIDSASEELDRGYIEKQIEDLSGPE